MVTRKISTRRNKNNRLENYFSLFNKGCLLIVGNLFAFLYFWRMNPKKSYIVHEIKQKIEQYCVYQDRCHKEVEEKIKSYNLIPEAREMILLSLMNDNFLNEERFAKSFARGKFRIKHWGKNRIVNELKMRDISAYNIKTALKEIDEKEYLKTIYTITEKRNTIISETNHYKRKKKLIDFLLRKGFETDLIFKVVDEVLS